MEINNYIIFSIAGFVNLILLIIIFFSKKRYNLFENKIYIFLMFLTLAGVLDELIMVFCVPYIENTPIIKEIVAKLFLLITEAWLYLLTMYTSAVVNRESSKEKTAISLEIKFLTGVYLFCALMTILMPIEYAYNVTGDSLLYTYGPSTKMVFVSSIIFISLIFIYVVRNKKFIKSKKIIPVYAYIILSISVSIIQQIDPTALLISFVESFVVLMMYFTIENPDMKVLEEVHRAKEITDSANEEKAMFLYNMTNEIRNITKDIDDSAENILSETDNKNINVENINDNARDIKVSTAKFTSMTNEILDISSIDSANIKIYNDKYNIKLILKELVQIYKNSAENKGLEFRTNIASDLPEYLYGDAVNVKVSLNTILDNAVKYTERGFIEFNVNAIMKNDIARLIISVEDSGVGMKAEDLNKIFNKREEDKENTNLKSNLYNAKKLVTLMGGTIIPSSIYGKGTIIKVVLDQKIGEVETELNKYESVYDKKKILIVDDNPSSIKMITKLLKDSNLIIDIANSGKECLDKIRDKEKYDLILLDENMTPLNGLTVMRKLQEIRNFNINVILLTKNNDYEYNEEYLKYGFKDYLIKPIDKDKLLKKISKYSK